MLLHRGHPNIDPMSEWDEAPHQSDTSALREGMTDDVQGAAQFIQPFLYALEKVGLSFHPSVIQFYF